jgi:RHS repeat-associated protein
MQLVLSTPSAPPPIPASGELNENLRQGFTARNPGWHPAPNVVNSTTALGLQAGLFLDGLRKSERARYYSPNTGRFIGEDPAGLIGGIDFYTYAEDNPLSYRDPFGLKPPPNPFNPTPWYQTCTAQALFSGAGSIAIDAIGLIPEAE